MCTCVCVCVKKEDERMSFFRTCALTKLKTFNIFASGDFYAKRYLVPRSEFIKTRSFVAIILIDNVKTRKYTFPRNIRLKFLRNIFK